MKVAWLSQSYAQVARSTNRLRQVSRLTPQFVHRAYSSQNGPAPRVAIIGSGPAGFYTARKLMREVHGTKVDMYERLPVPFGLVRFGVSPLHSDVKKCQDEFEQVASSPDFTFVGNVQLGQDLPLPLLAANYDAIIFSYGASQDRTLGLEGEDKPHVYSARAFVGWYNGLPEYRHLEPDLKSGENAVVIGQGNVAMDVARILLQTPDTLQHTDITNYALQTLKESRIKHVHIVGRRGPMQAAFTIKEVRELINLDGVNFKHVSSDLFPTDLKSLPRPKRRIMELLQKGKPYDPSATKSCSLDFLLAPQSLVWSDSDSNILSGIRLCKTKLENVGDPSSRVETTSETTTIPTSTLFRSIGYRAEAIPGMDLIGATFDTRSGTLLHDGRGRILPFQKAGDHTVPFVAPVGSPEQARVALYCAGWVKRGPTGVIASTMTDAFETAEAVAQDWASTISGGFSRQSKRGWAGVKEDALGEGYRFDKVVDWRGWRSIDASEKEIGKALGKPREKFGTVSEMLAAAGT